MHPKPVNTAFGSLSGGQNAPDPSYTLRDRTSDPGMRPHPPLSRLRLVRDLSSIWPPLVSQDSIHPDRESRGFSRFSLLTLSRFSLVTRLTRLPAAVGPPQRICRAADR